MAVTVDATATGVVGSALVQQSLTFSIGGGATAVIAILNHNRDTSARTCTCGGQTMQELGSQVTSTGPQRVSLFGIINPPTGSQEILANWTTSCNAALMSLSFSGTGTDTIANVFRNFTSTEGNSATPAITATSAVGNINVGVTGNQIQSITTPINATGSTGLYTNNSLMGSSCARAPGASSVAWSAGMGAATQWAIAAVDVSVPLITIYPATSEEDGAGLVSAAMIGRLLATNIEWTTHDPGQVAASAQVVGLGDIASDASPLTQEITVVVGSDFQPEGSPNSHVLANAGHAATYNPDYVLIAGDLCDASGATNYTNNVDASSGNNWWGRFSSIMRVCPGNHDGDSDGAYAGSAFASYFGSCYPGYTLTGSNSWGSWNLGAWHIISLNSMVSGSTFHTGEAQYDWLVSDLAANTGKPILCIWHYPRYSIETAHGPTDNGFTQNCWALLHAAHAEITVHGHCHTYQRWKPMDNTGAVAADGIRQFIDGTVGGYSYPTVIGGETRVDYYINTVENTMDTNGFMVFTLGASSYSWMFVQSSNDSTWTEMDSGSSDINTH